MPATRLGRPPSDCRKLVAGLTSTRRSKRPRSRRDTLRAKTAPKLSPTQTTSLGCRSATSARTSLAVRSTSASHPDLSLAAIRSARTAKPASARRAACALRTE